MKAPISLCIIVKDEPKLEECILSIKDFVEEIVIVDTGSTDQNTINIGKHYANIYERYTECNDSVTGLIEDFSLARQRSFDLATKPWVMWCDSDDIIVGGEHLLNLIKSYEANKGNTTGVGFLFPYEYSYDEVGKVNCVHYRERLLTKDKFKWVNPVHEVLIPKDNAGMLLTTHDEVIWKHRRQFNPKPAEPGRNLRILRKYVAGPGKDDARQLYYLGLECLNNGFVDEAIDNLTKYITVSGWEDERVMACLKLVDIYYAQGKYEEGMKWGFKSIEIKENWGEGYFALAKMFYHLAERGGPNEHRDWERCVYFAKAGLALPPTKTVLFVNPADREYDIHRYLNAALNKLGNVKDALESAEIGLKYKENDSGLLNNKKLYQAFLARQKAVEAINTLSSLSELSAEASGVVVALLNNQSIANMSLTQQAPAQNQNVPRQTYQDPNVMYPVTEGSFIEATVSPNANVWEIPNVCNFDALPIKMTDEQLQAVVILIWKQYMLHDEVLSAISFLENAPYNVRFSKETVKALKITKSSLAWMNDLSDFRKVNSPENSEVEAGNPLPNKLVWQEGNRFDLVANHLAPNSTIVDFGCMDGCFTNRLGMLGHKVTGLDICDSSLKLAAKKATEFHTNAEYVCTFFKDSADKVAHDHFDYATSSDTYEHLMDPVQEMMLPAKKMLKKDGKFLLVTPHGAWLRGQHCEWADPWVNVKKGKSWLSDEPRRHLVAPSVWSVAKHFRDAGYWVKDSYASLCSPKRDMADQGNVYAEAHIQHPKGYNEGLDVVIFVGDGVEAWTPETVKQTGIGGSEMMAINQAKGLVTLGHRVRIYSSCGKNGEGIYDGVEYHQTNKFQDLECDVLIISRRADMLADNFNIKAKLKLLWVHDVWAACATNELLLKADRVLALSEWHKQNLLKIHNIHPNHIIVTRNGIDLNKFKKQLKRNTLKCVNSSSPDRSWPILLSLWPTIKNYVPEAELHLYYGFKNWEFSAQHDQLQKDLIQRLKDQIASMAPLGVVYHDRISQDQLADEFLSAGAWIHPTWFTETSCITAMEAQAAGLRIVTSSIAALNETVADRGVLVDGDWTSSEYQGKFMNAVVNSLNNCNELDRVDLQKYATDHFGLDDLAKDWDLMFRSLIDELKINPTVPYNPTPAYRDNGKGYSEGDTRLAENDPRRNKLVASEPLKVNATEHKPAISVMYITMRIGGLDVLFDSLSKQTFKDFELVLTDSIYKYRKDIVAEKAKQYNFKVRHVEPTKNIFPVGCYCNGSNTGLINCAADLVLIITDFTYLPADCVEKHVKFHRDNPEENLGYMCPHQYKAVPELHPDFPKYGKDDADKYAEDLKDGKLNNLLWSMFKEDFNQDPESLPLDSMGNADTKLFMAPGPADQNSFNGKNESMKLEAALKINGYDEDLDQCHCWQDNVFSDMLVKKLGFTWIVDPSNKAYIINPRLYMPNSKWLRPYETNKIVWDTKQANNYSIRINDWSLREARNKIFNLKDKEPAISNELQKISVIVTTNRIGGLDLLFESLENQSYKNFELVLVDAIYNKRKDIVAEKAKQHSFMVKHLEPSGNTFPVSNYCKSINTGLCVADGPLVYLGCDYTVLSKDTLLTHAEFHSKTPLNHALLLPTDYFNIKENIISDKFPTDRKYGHNKLDTKFNLLVASEQDYIDIHNVWTDKYVDDLKTNLLDSMLWSFFKEEYNNDMMLNMLTDFGQSTVMDTRFNNTLSQVSQDLCNLKNNSFKLKFLLHANGMDELLDGTHGFQDTELARRLQKLHGAVFSAVDKGRVSILNIRFYLEPRKVVNGYNNIKIIDERFLNPKSPTNNVITSFKERQLNETL